MISSHVWPKENSKLQFLIEHSNKCKLKLEKSKSRGYRFQGKYYYGVYTLNGGYKLVTNDGDEVLEFERKTLPEIFEIIDRMERIK